MLHVREVSVSGGPRLSLGSSVTVLMGGAFGEVTVFCLAVRGSVCRDGACRLSNVYLLVVVL